MNVCIRAAAELFTLFMNYRVGGKSVFMGDAAIEPRTRRKNSKKDISGTWRVIPIGTRASGPRGKSAIKADKRSRHIRGYYRVVKAATRLAKLRRGELVI